MNLNKKLLKGGAVAALAGAVTLTTVFPGQAMFGTGHKENKAVLVVEAAPMERSTLEAVALSVVELPTTYEEAEASPWDSRLMPNVEAYLRIRTEPSTESEIAGKLHRGAVANVFERGEEWTKIQSGSVEGYVSNEFALFGAEAEAMANELGTLYATSTVDGLRIRAEASTEAGILGRLNIGEKIMADTAIEAPEGWVPVKSGEATAYVSADYITVGLELGQAISIEEEQAAIAKAKAEEEARRAAAEAAKKAEAEAAAMKAEAEARAKNETKPAATTATSPAPASADSQSVSTGGMRSATFKATAYCSCSICCGKWSGSNTASGTVPTAGRTIAVDPSVIPLGSSVKVKMPDGSIQTYVAEDTGGAVRGKTIDIYFSSHSQALGWGLRNVEVWY